MSCIRCDQCESIIDTDYNVEGVWEDKSPFRYWCWNCAERAIKDENKALLAALEVQDPETYKDLTT